jgi:citrate lyase subunit beta/citryl-CoA lyase
VSAQSLLFVPGDRPESIEKVMVSVAGAITFDLEDAVAPGKKSYARPAAPNFLRQYVGAVDQTVARIIRSKSLNPRKISA